MAKNKNNKAKNSGKNVKGSTDPQNYNPQDKAQQQKGSTSQKAGDDFFE